MNITSSLHVARDVILQVSHGFQGVGHALILLDVADDLGSFGAFGKVDQIGAFDDGGNTVFDEG